jgi:hypothetical protein
MDAEKEKILGWLRRRLTLDSDFMDDCASYDDMDALRWDPPAGFTMREEIRIRVSTEAHDILKTAINLFDTHNPKWEILPRGPVDADQAEQLERWLEWQMKVADQNGDKPASTTRLTHAAKYGRIAAQLDFLPYWVPEKNKKAIDKGNGYSEVVEEKNDEYAEAMANPFCVTVHPAATVHHERGKYGLRRVGVVNNIPAADAIDHWEAYSHDENYGEKIEGAIKKVQALLEEDDEARLMYVDFTSKEKRWCFAYMTTGESIDMELAPDEIIEFIWGENKLGFINWAISEAASTPLLYSLHKGGLWENQCFLDTIADTTVIRRGWFPIFKHKSIGGKPMEVDFTGNEAVVELDAAAGEEAEIMVPPPLDPGIREMMDRNSNKAASATGLKGLQNMSVVGNVQYASVNAMIQVSKSTLDPYLTCYQHNSVELGKLAFQWIAKSGKTITGYRTKDKSRDKNKVKGEKINVGPESFDPKTMIIQCELLPTNTSDEMQRMNVFSQAVQIGLPISKAEIVERMGWGEAEIAKQDWLKEQIESMALANFQKMQDLQLQMMSAQMQSQMQMQQQVQMQAMAQEQQGMVPPEQMGGSEMMPEGQANNPAMMGNVPAQSAPSMTQTATRRPG